MRFLRRLALIASVLVVSVLAGTVQLLADSHAMVLPIDATPLLASSPDGTEHRYTVEIADDAEERARGLMFRDTLPPDHGMLFVFPETRRVSFWMMNTPIPLDLIFIRADGRVARVERGKPFSRDMIDPGEPIRYVLELEAGTAKRAGIGRDTLISHPAIANAGAN